MLLSSITFAQISIDSGDMPSVGDTVRTSIALPPFSYDFSATGENFLWDFSDLLPVSQRLDTFKTVQQTPVFFWPSFFIVANMATAFDPGELLPGLVFDQAYQFIQKNASSYSDFGYGLIVQGLPLPLRFNAPDILYTFPMNYESSFSSDADLSFALPDIGYLAIDRNRQNLVDGWGNVTTPFGSFNALRLKSEIFEVDSIYIDSIGQGFRLERVYTEYKWIAKNQKIPILTVIDDQLLGTTVIYRDSIRDLTVGFNAKEEASYDLRVYPNPVNEALNVSFCANKTPMALRIVSMDGNEVFYKALDLSNENCQNFSLNLPMGIKPGIYLVQLINRDALITRRLVKK